MKAVATAKELESSGMCRKQKQKQKQNRKMLTEPSRLPGVLQKDRGHFECPSTFPTYKTYYWKCSDN